MKCFLISVLAFACLVVPAGACTFNAALIAVPQQQFAIVQPFQAVTTVAVAAPAVQAFAVAQPVFAVGQSVFVNRGFFGGFGFNSGFGFNGLGLGGFGFNRLGFFGGRRVLAAPFAGARAFGLGYGRALAGPRAVQRVIRRR